MRTRAGMEGWGRGEGGRGVRYMVGGFWGGGRGCGGDLGLGGGERGV